MLSRLKFVSSTVIQVYVPTWAALQIHDRTPKSRPVATLNQSQTQMTRGRDRSWNATRPWSPSSLLCDREVC